MPFLDKQLYRKISFKIRTYNRACRPLGEDFIHFATALYSPQFIQQEADRVEYTVRQRSGELGSLPAKDIVKIHQDFAGWNAEISDGSLLPLVSGPSCSPIIAEPQIDHHPRLSTMIKAMFDDLVACREISQLMITWKGRDAFYAGSRKRRGSGWNNRTTITSLQQRVPLTIWRQAQMEMERLASSMSLKMIREEDQHHNAQVAIP